MITLLREHLFICCNMCTLACTPFHASSFSLHLKTTLVCLFFHFALLLHVDLSVQLVYLGSEVLSHFVPLGLQRWSEQAVLDWEHLGVDVDGLHLKDKRVWAGCAIEDEHYTQSPQSYLVVHRKRYFKSLIMSMCTCSKDLRPPSLPSRTMSSKMADLTSCPDRTKERYLRIIMSEALLVNTRHINIKWVFGSTRLSLTPSLVIQNSELQSE